MAAAATKQAAPAPTITPGEQRIELQLEGVKSVLSAGFLALSQSNLRIEKLLERIAKAIEPPAAAAAAESKT